MVLSTLRRAERPAAPREQMGHNLTHLALRPDPASDRGPETIDEETREAADGWTLQPLPRLPVVEREVPCFIAHDASQQFGQDGMSGDLGESAVGGERGELVDGSPGHVQRCASAS